MLILIIVAIPLLGEALVFSLLKHRGHETAHAVIGKIVTDSVDHQIGAHFRKKHHPIYRPLCGEELLTC
jgi:hypothetical protein